MTQEMDPCDPRLHWDGVVAWERHGRWWQPWRLPPGRVATAFSPDLAERARMPAGVRATFRADARRLALPLEAGPDAAPLDILVDGVLHHRATPERTGQVEVELPMGDKLVEVWLPQFGEVRVGPFHLDGDITPAPLTGPRWITYGSSITQCGEAAGPSETWPALVARRMGWRLCCLGFAGQCHLDPVAMRTIRDMPADLISMCLGINIYGKATFSERTLASHAAGAIETVRDGHPGIPIVVVTPIACPQRETTPNAMGMTLRDIRERIREAAETLRRLGDAHLHVIDGRDLLGEPEAADLLPDGLHPSPHGYRLIAERIAPRLASAIPAARTNSSAD